METEATVQIEKVGRGLRHHRIMLHTQGRVPGIEESEFQQHAEAAKEGCPVSQALAGVESIEVEAQLLD